MRNLSIDIETYSSMDLAKSGVYAYTQSEDFEILLFGYAFDEEEVRVIDLKCGEMLPIEVIKGLTSPEVLKTAFNANFERTCIRAYFHVDLEPEQWSCTEVMALSLGLPSSLEAVGECLKLGEQKMKEGRGLIRYFTSPCKDIGINFRNLPEDDRDKWEEFKKYCARDVEVERNIRKLLEKYPVIDRERKLWCLDQRINDRGIRVDSGLIHNALLCNLEYEKRLINEAMDLTGIDNPKSTAQMRKWLLQTEGMNVESLAKENLEGLMDRALRKDVKRVLEIRQSLSKTSIKKYETMEKALGSDGRIRGLFQFYGANRTGRWAGRLVQVQNLPRNNLQDSGNARELLKEGQVETLELLYDSIPEVLSQLIRTAFIPAKGCRFIISDFSAIEARIIAWLAGERWRMEVFNSLGNIYESSAAKMFKVPENSIDKDSPLRQKGKIAELALGYQGSRGALIAMGALKLGLREEELPELVAVWRYSNQKIVKLWKDVETAAVTAVRKNIPVKIQYGIEFYMKSGILFIRLPSGRCLSYINPRTENDGMFNKQVLTYEGAMKDTKKWGRLKTYGGKLVENIVQGIARDCLCEAMMRLWDRGYRIVMHVHDEVVLEVPYGFGTVEEVEEIMGMGITWAEGLVLKGECFEGEYYCK